MTKDRIELAEKNAHACEALTIGFLPEQFEGREAHWRCIESIRELSGWVIALVDHIEALPSPPEDGWKDSEKVKPPIHKTIIWGWADGDWEAGYWDGENPRDRKADWIYISLPPYWFIPAPPKINNL